MNAENSKIRKRWTRRSGNIMVEFAIGSAILTTVFGGMFQFGYYFYQYNALLEAVVSGAHFAAQYQYDSLTSTPSTSFSTKVKNMVVYGDPTGTNTTPVLRGLTTGNVNLTVGMLGSGTNLVPSTMTISISNYTINGIFGTYTCNNKPTVTYPYQGVFSPHP